MPPATPVRAMTRDGASDAHFACRTQIDRAAAAITLPLTGSAKTGEFRARLPDSCRQPNKESRPLFVVYFLEQTVITSVGSSWSPFWLRSSSLTLSKSWT
jgi:hypothetical protein